MIKDFKLKVTYNEDEVSKDEIINKIKDIENIEVEENSAIYFLYEEIVDNLLEINDIDPDNISKKDKEDTIDELVETDSLIDIEYCNDVVLKRLVNFNKED